MLRLILNQGRFIYKYNWILNQKIERFSSSSQKRSEEELIEEEIQKKLNDLNENDVNESGQSSEYETGSSDELNGQQEGSDFEQQSGSDESSSDGQQYQIEEVTQSEIEDDTSDIEIDSEEVQEYGELQKEIDMEEVPYTKDDIEELLIDDQDFEEEKEQMDKIIVSHQDYAYDERILYRSLSKAGVFTNNINEIHLNKLQFVYPIIGDNSDVPKWIQQNTQQYLILQQQINDSIFTQIEGESEIEEEKEEEEEIQKEFQNLGLEDLDKDEQQEKEDLANEKRILQKKKENEISNQQAVLSYKKLSNYVQDYEEMQAQKDIHDRWGQSVELTSEQNYQDYRNLIYDFVKNMASRNQIHLIQEYEFRFFLMTQEFHGLLHYFRKKSFFINKPTYLDTWTIIQLIKISINDPVYFKTLGFIRYAVHQDSEKQSSYQDQFRFTQADLKNVIHILKNHNQHFNNLSFIFSINNLFGNQLAKQLDHDLLLDFVSKIYFGPMSHPSHHQIFSQYIKDLIYLQLKVKIHPEFQAFILDSFFGNNDYEEAVTKLSLIYIILSKIINGQDNLNHIFQIYINTFGQSNFQFFIINQLVNTIIIILLLLFYIFYYYIIIIIIFKGRILKQQKFKKMDKVYNQSLNNFNNQKSKEIKINMNNLNFLEQKLFSKECQIIYLNDDYLQDEPVYIDSFSQSDSIIQQQGKKLREKKEAEFMKYYKHLFLENDEKFINSLLKESFVQNEYQMEDFYFQKDKNITEQNEYLYNKNCKKVNMHLTEFGFKQRKFKDFTYQKTQLNNKNTFSFCNNNTKLKEEQKEEKQSNNNDNQTEQINKNTENKEYSKFKRFLKIQEEIDQSKKQEEKSQIDNFQEPKQQQKKKKQAKIEQNSGVKFAQLETDKKIINQQIDKIQEQIQLDQSQIILDEFKTQINVFINQNNFEQGEEYLKKQIQKIGEKKNEQQKYIDKILEINTNSQDQKSVIGLKVLINMFLFSREEREETSQSLVLDQKVNEDLIQKDFNKYLMYNQFKYALSNNLYASIFEFLYLQYDRKLFKKTISHFVKYNTNLDPKISKIIALICCKEKIGFSLLEFQLLLVQNKITQSEQALSIQIESLGEFKNLQDYIQDIIIKNVMYQSYDFKFAFVQKYIDKLLQKQQFENIMILFEKIRDYQLSRKANIKQLNQDNIKEIEKIQEDFKQQNKIKLQSLYREMIVYFNKKQNGLLYSQLLNQDMINNKLSMQEADYINQIDSFRYVPAQIIRIYKNIVIDQNLIITNEILDQFMKVIQLNKQDLKSFFEKLIRDYVFSGNIQISYSNIININNTFQKLKEQALFPEYLTHMIQTNILFDKKEYIKDSFQKAFDQCKNESNSVLLSSMIDKLFSLDRKLIIESKSKRLTPEQREQILLQMSLQQKEMMKREGQSIQDKDNEKLKMQAKQSKQNKQAQSAINNNRLVVEKEIDELEIVSEDLLDKENQIDAEQFEVREQKKFKKQSQLTNLERNIKPRSKQKDSRQMKEQLMQAFIFGEIDQEDD